MRPPRITLRDVWRTLGLVAAFGFAVGIIVLAILAVFSSIDQRERNGRLQARIDQQAVVIEELSETLNRRTPVIAYIEATAARAECVDTVESRFEVASGNFFQLVVRSATLPEGERLPEDVLAAATAELEAAKQGLHDLSVTCPPVPRPAAATGAD